MRVGDSLKPWTVVAQNDATDSGNEIHNDRVARQYGFRGGLVPGVTVYGYLTGPLVAAFGPEWLDRGGLRIRLRRPVYEGERIAVESRVTKLAPRTEVELTARSDAGEACAVGTGWMLGEVPLDPAPLPPQREVPGTRWPPERATFERERALGSVAAVWNRERAAGYLEQDNHPIYRSGVAHPAWLLRLANLVVDRSIAVNPWIHVSSDVQNWSRAHAGERLETRAAVLGFFERNGHAYVDLDVAIVAPRADAPIPILRATHRAIYRPRPLAESAASGA